MFNTHNLTTDEVYNLGQARGHETGSTVKPD